MRNGFHTDGGIDRLDGGEAGECCIAVRDFRTLVREAGLQIPDVDPITVKS